jgi:hypothetical protein
MNDHHAQQPRTIIMSKNNVLVASYKHLHHLVFASASLFAAEAAWPAAVANLLNEVALAPETVALIDPVSGVSVGTPGSDLKIAVGDIFLVRFTITPLPDSRLRGVQSYLTVYVPGGAEFVGARIIDTAGNSIVPNPPGLAVDGCSGGSDCNVFDNLPCNDGLDNCDFAGGSISQVYGDTGIFFSDDLRLSPDPGDSILTPVTGIEMSPQPAGIEPVITELLGYATPFFSHNAWDWAQVRAFGTTTDEAGTGGGGNTPFFYGSPVAGPLTYYAFEATDNGAFGIEFNNVTGPWQRSFYPGSQIGFGNSGASGAAQRMSLPTAAGLDIKPANAFSARAVRFAMGEARVGQPMLAEIALKVTAVPINPGLGENGENVLCAEAFGGAVSLVGTGNSDAHHPFRSYINAPLCLDLQRQVSIEANSLLYDGDPMEFSLGFRNLSLVPEETVVMRQIYDAALMSFTSAIPAPDSGPAPCQAPYDTSKTCLGWNLGHVDPAQEVMVSSTFDALVQDGISVTHLAVESAALPAPGAQSSAVSIITPITNLAASLAPTFNPTAAFASAGTSVPLTGTFGNNGTGIFSWEGLELALPSGWTVTNNQITVGAVTVSCSIGCGTRAPQFSLANVLAADSQLTISFSVNVPANAGSGLYTLDLRAFGQQSGFGALFETYFPRTATINVASARTEKPAIVCPPIRSTDPLITGTAEVDSDISLRFNLGERGTCLADELGNWACDFANFGDMYGGLEVRATARAPGELESELSDACFVAPHLVPTGSIFSNGFESTP